MSKRFRHCPFTFHGFKIVCVIERCFMFLFFAQSDLLLKLCTEQCKAKSTDIEKASMQVNKSSFYYYYYYHYYYFYSKVSILKFSTVSFNKQTRGKSFSKKSFCFLGCAKGFVYLLCSFRLPKKKLITSLLSFPSTYTTHMNKHTLFSFYPLTFSYKSHFRRRKTPGKQKKLRF